MSNQEIEKQRVKEFIDFYKAIPVNNWTTNRYEALRDGKPVYCAHGHLGVRDNNHVSEVDKACYLSTLFSDHIGASVPTINDDESNAQFKQKTPKGRILAALRFIQKKLERK